jgi:hypothetical protein
MTALCRSVKAGITINGKKKVVDYEKVVVGRSGAVIKTQKTKIKEDCPVRHGMPGWD